MSKKDGDAGLETLDCYHGRMANSGITRRYFLITSLEVLRKALAWSGVAPGR